MESFTEPLVHLSDTKVSLQGSVELMDCQSLAYSATLRTPQEWAEYEGRYYRWHSAPAHFMSPSSTTYAATFAHHMGTILLISRRPAAKMDIVVTPVLDCHLLYNETSLVNTMRMEVPTSMRKS
jgi:hypothetical protein